MEQSVEFLKRYCTENFDHGFNDIVETHAFEAAEEAIEKNTRETAKSMLKKGIKINLIKEITGLSKAEINKLKKEI